MAVKSNIQQPPRYPTGARIPKPHRFESILAQLPAVKAVSVVVGVVCRLQSRKRQRSPRLAQLSTLRTRPMANFLPSWSVFRLNLAFGTVLTVSVAALAQESVRLQERFSPNYQYRVSSRVELAGRLSLPPEKDKTSTPLTIKGTSAIDYDERVLAVRNDGQVDKTVRIYRRMDFERQVGPQLQKNALREEVRRLVVLRRGHLEVPFCPEGPLTWGEIDLVRTDVFTPALAGLLPERAVREGDRWLAATGAVQELTDLERIEEGRISCHLETVVVLDKRRLARVALSGTVRGLGEDGPCRHTLEGYFFFDLQSQHLSYLFFKGVRSLLDKGEKEVGRVEGQFTLTRQANITARELTEEALKGLTLEPNADNSLLLYDNADLGIRFLYPRRWRMAGDLGQQVRLDGSNGSGVLLTLEPPARMPSAVQFLEESRNWFASQKGSKVLRSDPPQRVQAAPRALDHFTMEVDREGKRMLMDYYVVNQAAGGVTLAASLPWEDRAALQKEILYMAQSIRLFSPRRPISAVPEKDKESTNRK